jgi:hypothetical protein
MTTIKDDIAALLAKAAPLRELDHDDPRAAPLAGIVDEINRLRAAQERERHEQWKEGYFAENPPVAEDTENAGAEGADALPSREELEEAAAGAGVKFSARIGDRALFDRLKKAGAL